MLLFYSNIYSELSYYQRRTKSYIYNIGRDTLSQRNAQHAKDAEYSTMSSEALKEVRPV